MGKKNKIKLETGTVYQKEEGGTYYFRYQLSSHSGYYDIGFIR